jgi:hypothetical protein
VKTKKSGKYVRLKGRNNWAIKDTNMTRNLVIYKVVHVRNHKAMKSMREKKSVPLHAMEAHGGRGGIVPTHT